jgi:hypothetical protein
MRGRVQFSWRRLLAPPRQHRREIVVAHARSADWESSYTDHGIDPTGQRGSWRSPASSRAVSGSPAAVIRAQAPDHNHGTPPDGGTCGHVDNAGGLTLVSHGDTLVSLYGFTFDPHYPNQLTMPLNGVVHGIQVTFKDQHNAPIAIANDCAINSLAWTFTDPSIAEGAQDPGLRWYFNVTGKHVGSTVLRIKLVHDSHSHYMSEPIPIVVTGP